MAATPMNQELRNRRAIDLDELERQLRLSSEPVQQPATSDPLAELARLVGQDDPFKDVFSRQGLNSASHMPNNAAQARPGQEQVDMLNQLEADMRADLRPAHGYDTPVYEPYPDTRRQPEAALQDDFYEQHAAPEPRYVPPPPAKRPGLFRLRNLVLAAGFIGISGFGVFAAFGMRSGNLLTKSFEVPIIIAKSGPTKERPENPGGVEVPNQNKQIYESGTKSGAAGAAKVVNSVEQPVDLSTSPRAAVPRVVLPGPASLPGGGTGPVADAANPAGAPSTTASVPGSGSSEPKRVRSVPIKIGDAADALPQVASAQSAPSVTAPPAATAPGPSSSASPSIASLIGTSNTSLSLSPSSTAALNQSPPSPAVVPLPPSQRPRAAVATPEQVNSSPVSAAPKPTPATPAPKVAVKTPPKKVTQPVAAPLAAAVEDSQPNDDGAPLALSPPRAKAGQKIASAAPSTATTGSGGWTIQLASRPSDADASQAASQLGQRFGSQLGGAKPRVVQGDANGKTVYRVRVGSYDREKAVSLCEQLKSAGGSCFVAKN